MDLDKRTLKRSWGESRESVYNGAGSRLVSVVNVFQVKDGRERIERCVPRASFAYAKKPKRSAPQERKAEANQERWQG